MENSNKKDMQEKYTPVSIKDLIIVIWNGKWIIVTLTAAALILTFLYSFIILDKTYVSTATLSAQPIEEQNITTETFIAQLKSNDLLEKTMDSISTMKTTGEVASTGELSDIIEISTSDDFIKVSVTHPSPQMAMLIANIHSENFIEFVSNDMRKNALNDIEILNEQIKHEEETLFKKGKELEEYLSEYKSIDSLKNEISALYSQIAIYQTEHINAQKNIQIYSEELAGLYKMAEDAGINTDAKIEGDISFTNRLGSVVNPLDADLEEALLIMEIINTEQDLLYAQSSIDAISALTEDMRRMLTEKQIELLNNEYLYEKLKSEHNFSKETCLQYKQLLEIANDQVNSFSGEKNITIVANAVAPALASGPDILQNLITSFVIGLVFGIAIVLFRDFLKQDKKRKTLKG